MAAAAETVDVGGGGIDFSMSTSVALNADLNAVSAAGGAAAVTVTADTERPLIISEITVGYSAAPTGGSIKIEDGATTTWGPFPITAAGTQHFVFEPAWRGSKNSALTITAASGGGAVVATVAVKVWKHK